MVRRARRRRLRKLHIAIAEYRTWIAHPLAPSPALRGRMRMNAERPEGLQVRLRDALARRAREQRAHAALLGLLLQARSQVHRVPDGRVVEAALRADVAYHR